MSKDTSAEAVTLRILQRALRDTRDRIAALESEEEELMVEIAKLEEVSDGQ